VQAPRTIAKGAANRKYKRDGSRNQVSFKIMKCGGEPTEARTTGAPHRETQRIATSGSRRTALAICQDHLCA
jgi:hypothetical protein